MSRGSSGLEQRERLEQRQARAAISLIRTDGGSLDQRTESRAEVLRVSSRGKGKNRGRGNVSSRFRRALPLPSLEQRGGASTRGQIIEQRKFGSRAQEQSRAEAGARCNFLPSHRGEEPRPDGKVSSRGNSGLEQKERLEQRQAFAAISRPRIERGSLEQRIKSRAKGIRVSSRGKLSYQPIKSTLSSRTARSASGWVTTSGRP